MIDENEEMVGVVDVEAALRRAREVGLDLVEVSAAATPPVVRIMDFGKWKYEQAKKDRATKAKSKTTDLKEVRLGRSMKIDPHDVEIRLEQARRFLLDGHKVQVVQNLRGREMLHKDRGQERMSHIISRLSDIARVEASPRFMGRRITMILSPDRAKIEQARQRDASRKPGPVAAEAPAEALAEEEEPAVQTVHRSA